jgi:DNA-binding winged helix-turn-helix (wHTH) protein
VALRALLMRAPGPTSALQLANVRIDPHRRTASMDGQPLELTRRDFDLLEVLARNSGLVLSRSRLLELVWGYDFDVRTDVVDTFVSYLRRKLEAGGRPRLIHTVRGVGFVLRPRPEAPSDDHGRDRARQQGAFDGRLQAGEDVRGSVAWLSERAERLAPRVTTTWRHSSITAPSSGPSESMC